MWILNARFNKTKRKDIKYLTVFYPFRYPPSISTIDTSNKRSHRLISAPRLHLIILASTLLTPSALELIGFGGVVLGHLGVEEVLMGDFGVDTFTFLASHFLEW